MGITVFATTFAPSGANAQSVGGLFVEPGLTYELGKTSVDYPAPLSNSSGEANGFGLTGRFGVHVHSAVFLALDARYAMPKFTDSSVSYDAQATSFNWGPVVGVQMPVAGLRVWGGYVAGGYLDPEASGAVDVKFQDSTGFRVGAGFRLAMLSLNLEYQNLSYGKAQLEKLGPFTPGTNFDSVKLENESWIASVSFPLEL
jgi:hypothetical protein